MCPGTRGGELCAFGVRIETPRRVWHISCQFSTTKQRRLSQAVSRVYLKGLTGETSHTHCLTQTEVPPLLLSHFSCVQVFETLWTITCQAPLNFSTHLNLWRQTHMPIEGFRNGAQSVSRVHKNARKEILLCLNTKGKKKTEKKIKIYKCLIKCLKKMKHYGNFMNF